MVRNYTGTRSIPTPLDTPAILLASDERYPGAILTKLASFDGRELTQAEHAYTPQLRRTVIGTTEDDEDEIDAVRRPA